MTLLQLLLIVHILMDFYIKGPILNKVRKRKIIFFIIYTLVYSASLLFLLVLAQVSEIILLVPIGIAIIIFVCNYLLAEIKNEKTRILFFLINQLVHLSILITIWVFFKDNIIDFSKINKYLNDIDISLKIEMIINILFILLLIGKPTSILIEKMLPKNITNSGDDSTSSLSDEKNKSSYDVNYGSIIGILERITIVFLAVLNLWSSIALVFTAKSIARFKQLEDKNFAQKYLIGTLLSLVITLGVLLIFYNF